MSGLPPFSVLLTMGDYYGTLAAARHFGRMGFQVTLAEWRSWTPTRFSRFVTRTVRCPPLSDDKAFVSWLLDFGRQNRGHFLYPTSDDAAWLFSVHGSQLHSVFHMIETPMHVTYTLLNKNRLAEAAKQCRIASPEILAPTSEGSLQAIIEQLDGSWMIKPTTQIGLITGYKGEHLDGNRPLEHYQEFRDKLRYRQFISAFDPLVQWPILQRFYPHARDSIISIAGYRCEDGSMSFLSARKLLQFPQQFGVGICFEELPHHSGLEASLNGLLSKVGFHGIFEAEFIDEQSSGRHLLIDVNPRFYGQMAFEIARGVPLPSLAFYDAIGWQAPRMAHTVAAATPMVPRHFGNISLLALVLLARTLSRQISLQTVGRWFNFCFAAKGDYKDAVFERSDLGPWAVEVCRTLGSIVCHPRSSWRKFFLNV